ncbi:MAG TPA: magnesium/cobalt transporter CorA [Actinomycetota bacterium]|nr:magnesium/cobalt transporter CorA [Actinomycetota bacterium]
MITCRIYRDGVLDEEKPFVPAAVEAARSSGGYAWLDAVEPTDDELRTLQDTFELHPLSVEDSSRWGQRSKVEVYSDYVFLVAHGLRLDDDDRLIDSEVHLFARKDSHLITVRRKPLFDFPSVVQRAKGEHRMPQEGVGFLLYLLLDEIVDGYLDAIDRLEDLGDDIEERASREDSDRGASDDLAADIFRLRQLVVRFRRLAVPMREVVDLLMEAPGIVTDVLAPYYRDVLDHVIRVTELSDNVRDLLTSARELQLAQISNRLNVVMKQLTAWAAIILIPTLIAGVYGMNFEHMPELSWRLGYPMALGLMAGAAFLLYLVFKKQDWL